MPLGRAVQRVRGSAPDGVVGRLALHPSLTRTRIFRDGQAGSSAAEIQWDHIADFGYLEHSSTRGEVIMKVVTLQDIPHVPAEGGEPIEGWTGAVSRSRQIIIQPGDSTNYNCSVVNFSQGCTTGWHTHNCDQVLVVTSGSGMVATEHEQHEINVGDVVHIKAGERHWHGAKADTTMGHITITAVGGQATWG